MQSSDESDALVRRANADYWGPHEVPKHVKNPQGVGITFWVADGQAYAFGHELDAECPCGEEMDAAGVDAGQALVFKSEDEDHSLAVHPYTAKPESWEVYGAGGVKASYEGTPEDGVYEWVVEVDGEERRYRIHAPSIAEMSREIESDNNE